MALAYLRCPAHRAPTAAYPALPHRLGVIGHGRQWCPWHRAQNSRTAGGTLVGSVLRSVTASARARHMASILYDSYRHAFQARWLHVIILF